MKKVFIVIILLSYVSVGFGQIDRFKNRIDKEISPIIMSQANKILENRDFGLNKDSVCVYPFYIFDQGFGNLIESKYLDYTFLDSLQAKVQTRRDFLLYPAELMFTDKQGNLMGLFQFSVDGGGELSKSRSLFMGKLNDEGDTDILKLLLAKLLHNGVFDYAFVTNVPRYCVPDETYISAFTRRDFFFCIKGNEVFVLMNDHQIYSMKEFVELYGIWYPYESGYIYDTMKSGEK